MNHWKPKTSLVLKNEVHALRVKEHLQSLKQGDQNLNLLFLMRDLPLETKLVMEWKRLKQLGLAHLLDHNRNLHLLLGSVDDLALGTKQQKIEIPEALVRHVTREEKVIVIVIVEVIADLQVLEIFVAMVEEVADPYGVTIPVTNGVKLGLVDLVIPANFLTME